MNFVLLKHVKVTAVGKLHLELFRKNIKDFIGLNCVINTFPCLADSCWDESPAYTNFLNLNRECEFFSFLRRVSNLPVTRMFSALLLHGVILKRGMQSPRLSLERLVFTAQRILNLCSWVMCGWV